MTDERFDLSRRQALAALGTIGVASAGAGLGTSAYFSDQETFENNRLTAGELDLKIGWQEHYSNWMDDDYSPYPGQETTYAEMPDSSVDADISLPPGPERPAAEAIELAFVDPSGDDGGSDSRPDQTDGGRQFLRNTQRQGVNGGIYGGPDTLCGTDADVPDNRALIEVGDLKPGDFGIALFRLELCTNPGFLWLHGSLVDANENGVTEPEADDPDAESGTVELLDEVQVAYAVGTTNNIAATTPTQNPLPLPDDGLGSSLQNQTTLRTFLNDLEDGTGIGLEGDIAAEEGGGAGGNCFAGETDHYASVVWWLPIDHGNQVQSDSVTFDLGFYTEQCRHNRREVRNCPDCPFNADAAGGGFTNLLSVGSDRSLGFPAIDARVRVDTPLGRGGDLTTDDFAICEEGCGQTIDDVSFETGGAVDIVVVFDDSTSMSDEIESLKDMTLDFTSGIESAGLNARYALVSFRNEAEVDQDFTDATTFDSAVQALPTRPTAGPGDNVLFPEDNLDALAVATGNAAGQDGSDDQLSAFRSGAQRVIIDITDERGAFDEGGHGADPGTTRFSQSEVESFLNGGNFIYFAVARPGQSSESTVGKESIAANVDNGRFIDITEARDPSSGQDFSDILNDIVSDLTEPAYVLSYTTTNGTTDGATRTVDVETIDPDQGSSYDDGDYSAPSS